MATEFIVRVRVGGSVGTDCDFTGLAAAETQLRADLTAAATRVYSGTKTGTIADGATLYLWQGGSVTAVTATCRRSAYGNSRIMVSAVSNTATPATGNIWSTSNVDGTTNIFTISSTIGAGNGDTVQLSIECDTAGNADALSSNFGFSYVNWTTGASNFIVLRAYNGNEASTEWSTTKYRIQPNTGISPISISTYYFRLERIQIYATNRQGVSITPNATHDIRVTGCHVRQTGATAGGFNGINVNVSSVGTVRLYNNVVADFDRGTGTLGVGIVTTGTNTIYVYNNTVRNCAGGMYRNGGTLYAKNNIVSGCDFPLEAYGGTFNAASQNNLSDSIVTGGDYNPYADLCFGVVANSGTTDGMSAGKLIQTGQNFASTVKVGMIVRNTTTGTGYARVTAVDSDTQLSVDNDVFALGAAYSVYSNFQGAVTFTSATDHGLSTDDTMARENGFEITSDLYPGTDINGTVRPNGTYWDIGAHEAYAVTPPVTTSSTSSSSSSSTTILTTSTYTLAIPDTLYSNDTVPGAQLGETNPTNLTDLTPAFSARVFPRSGVLLTQVQIQVNQNSDFSGTHEWDSGWLTLNDPIATTQSIPDIEYGQA